MMRENGRIAFTVILILSAVTGIRVPAALTGSPRGGSDPTPQGVKLLWMSSTVGGVREVLITSGGEYVTAGGKGFVKRMEAGTGKETWSIERPLQVDSMAEAGDGSIVLAGLEQARLWAIKGDGSICWELSTEGPVLALDLTGRGDKAVFGTFFGTLYFAYPMRREVEAIHRREGAAVIRAALSADGDTAAIGYSDDAVEGFKWGDPEPIWHVRVEGHPKVLAFSPERDRLILGTDNGRLYALDPRNGETLWVFEAADAISCVEFLEEDSMAVGSHDGYVYLINLEDGSNPWRYKVEGAVKSMAYIRNGSILCIGGTDRRFRALDLDAGMELGSVKAGYWVTSISASENGIAAFGAGKTLYTVRITVEGGGEHPSPGGGELSQPRKNLVYGASIILPALGAAGYLLVKHRRDKKRVV